MNRCIAIALKGFVISFCFVFLLAHLSGCATTPVEPSPLMMAIKQNDSARIKTLFEKSTDINGTDGKGWTALTWAAYTGRADIVKLLLDKGVDVYGNDLNIAAQRGDVNIVKLLLAKVKFGNESLVTAMRSAAVAGHADAVKLLIDSGADPNILYRGTSQTALMLAAQNDRADVIQVLLDNGANINAKEASDSWTALSWAAYKENPDLVRLFLNNGADAELALAALEAYAGKWANSSADNAANESTRTKLGIRLIETFARKKGVAQSTPTAAGVKSELKLAPVVKSDVDELPAFKVKPRKNAYAVVIGIENYRQKLPTADFATHDAQTMTEYLVKVFGYPEENVITLLNDNASNVDLAKYFEKWLPNNVEPNGTVFVYYSGHGAPNPKTGDAYIVPYDGDPSFIDQTGYSLQRLYNALGRLPAKEIVVALDSCFSGAGGRSVLAQGARPLVINLEKVSVLPKNLVVMSAASGDQISSTYRDKGHGLFTYFMLKGIKTEDVTRADGTIRMDDLFGYVKPQVERIARKQYNNEQSPQLIGQK